MEIRGDPEDPVDAAPFGRAEHPFDDLCSTNRSFNAVAADRTSARSLAVAGSSGSPRTRTRFSLTEHRRLPGSAAQMPGNPLKISAAAGTVPMMCPFHVQ